jgi:S1-C subfamily serine protease
LVRAMDVPPAIAQSAHVSPPQGVLILAVNDGGVAQQGGVLEGDIITSFSNVSISRMSDMQQALATISAGSVVKATVWRNGVPQPLTLRF